MFKQLLLFMLTLFFFGFCAKTYAAQTSSAQRTLDAYAPFEELIQVSGSDSLEYDPPLRGCMIEAAGDLYLQTIKGDSTVAITTYAGQLIPALITNVMASTTSTQVCGR